MGTIMKNISLRYIKQRNLMATISLEEIGENENPIDTFPLMIFRLTKRYLA